MYVAPCVACTALPISTLYSLCSSFVKENLECSELDPLMSARSQKMLLDFFSSSHADGCLLWQGASPMSAAAAHLPEPRPSWQVCSSTSLREDNFVGAFKKKVNHHKNSIPSSTSSRWRRAQSWAPPVPEALRRKEVESHSPVH